MFRPRSNAEHIRFENYMLFNSPKQFKDAITEYAMHGGWDIRFVKNDKLRVRVHCQPNSKFVAYLAKMARDDFPT